MALARTAALGLPLAAPAAAQAPRRLTCNFKGFINEVRIYRRALTRSDIQALMQ